jgi:hypothetical protein
MTKSATAVTDVLSCLWTFSEVASAAVEQGSATIIVPPLLDRIDPGRVESHRAKNPKSAPPRAQRTHFGVSAQRRASRKSILGHLRESAFPRVHPSVHFLVIVDDGISLVLFASSSWPSCFTRAASGSMNSSADWIHVRLMRRFMSAGALLRSDEPTST